MKKFLLTMTLAAVMMFGGARTSQAATLLGDYFADMGAEIEVSAAVDYYSKYVWRGFLLDGDQVIQPSVTVSFMGFEGGFWGSWDMENNDSLASDESDGWIGYGFDLGFIDESLEIVGVSVGNTWYAFPEASTHTSELYVGLSVDTLLSPYFTWYHDYEDESKGGADGNYYMFGIGHSFTLNEEYGVSLDLGYELGLNDEAFIVGDGGYNLITAGLTIPLSDNVTMAPVLGYSMPFGDLEDAADGNQDDEFYGGVSLSFSM